jgi:hypothetical protein
VTLDDKKIVGNGHSKITSIKNEKRGKKVPPWKDHLDNNDNESIE